MYIYIKGYNTYIYIYNVYIYIYIYMCVCVPSNPKIKRGFKTKE